MKTILLSLVLFSTTLFHGVFAQTATADALIGTWTVADGTAKIKIEKVNGKYMGKMVWLNPATDKKGNPILDKNNPDKKLQTRPLMGLPMLQNFVFSGDNIWSEGTIYDPDGGDTYSCKITMTSNDAIDVRGYVGISLFGRTETWKRCQDVVMK